MQYIESLLAQEPNQNSYDPTVNARLRGKELLFGIFWEPEFRRPPNKATYNWATRSL